MGTANSAWTYDEATEEFFLSLFTPEQPDLNWEIPEVRAAVHDVMHFWLKRGVSGYRMDVINMISKDQRFPDAEPNLGPDAKYHPGGKYYFNGPRMHEYIQDLNAKVLSKYDTITVGEMPAVEDIDEILRTVGDKSKELNMIFIFDLVDIDNEHGKDRMTLRKWTVPEARGIIDKWQSVMIKKGGWNSVFCENHDNPRSVSRFTDDSDAWRDHGVKLLALMQTTLSGTLYVYQGEELGMRNVPKSWDVEEYKDIESINFWKKSKASHANGSDGLARAKEILEKKARDHARTPVQWTDGPNAGFCEEGVKPWMRVHDDYKEVNAEKQIELNSDDQLSAWQFWKRGIESRKEHADVFVYGDYQMMEPDGDQVFAYVRTGREGGKWLVVLNLTGEAAKWEIPGDLQVHGWMAGTYMKGRPKISVEGSIDLRPWEGLLGKCRD